MTLDPDDLAQSGTQQFLSAKSQIQYKLFIVLSL